MELQHLFKGVQGFVNQSLAADIENSRFGGKRLRENVGCDVVLVSLELHDLGAAVTLGYNAYVAVLILC